MKFSSVPAHSFSHSPKGIIQKSDTPGPGNYTPFKTTLYNEPHWKIGTQKREVFEKKEDNPGPGYYNPPTDIQEGPKYSIHSKLNLLDDKNKNNFPGPGAYRPMYKSRSYFYSFGIKHKKSNKNKESTPGPGNYEVRTEKDMVMPSYLFGKEKRENETVKNKRFIPGPGAYNQNKEFVLIRNPKYTFGSKLKPRNFETLAPGPGTYNYKSLMGKEGTKITIGLKLNNTIDQGKNTPGPGAYRESKINFYKKKPPYAKLGKSKRLLEILKINTNPGPGHYSYLESEKLVKVKSPSWKMGTSIRKSLSQTDVSFPGVGRYSISGTPGANAPKFSMRIKSFMSRFKNDVPGPGQYDSMNMSIYNRAPSWKMGTLTRDSELRKTIREDFPGPGKYEVNTDQSDSIKYKFKFGIKKRFSKRRTNDNPGPGSYHIPCSFVDVSNYSREKGNFDDNFKYI